MASAPLTPTPLPLGEGNGSFTAEGVAMLGHAVLPYDVHVSGTVKPKTNLRLPLTMMNLVLGADCR